MEWETIVSDPEFQSLPFDKKKNVAKGWFAETVSPDPEFQAMPVERRDWTYSNFLKDSGLLKPTADPAKAIIQQQIGGKVPEGYKYNELGELEPVEAVAKQKGYVEALHEPTAKPTGIGDYVTRVIPESIQKTAYGLARMPYDAVKGVTDPLVHGFQRAVSGEQDTPENVGQVFTDIGKNAAGFVTGMSEFMGKPIGLYGWEEMKKAWLTDPAGSIVGIAPMVKGVVAKAKSWGVTPKEAIPKIFEEAKESGVSVADVINDSMVERRAKNAPMAKIREADKLERLSMGRPIRSGIEEPVIPGDPLTVGSGPPRGIVSQNAPAKAGPRPPEGYKFRPAKEYATAEDVPTKIIPEPRYQDVRGESIEPLVNREAEMGNFFQGDIPITSYAPKFVEAPVERLMPTVGSGPPEGIRSQTAGGRPKTPTVNLESSGLQTVYEKLRDSLKAKVTPNESGLGAKIEYLKDGEVVGSGQLRGKEITNIQVKEEFRKQGVGTEIIKDLVARGGESGYPATEAGKKLMTKAGMEPLGGGEYGVKKPKSDITLESSGLQTIYEKFFAQPDPPKFAQPGTPEAAIEGIHQANREAGRKRDKVSFEKVKSVFFKNITGTDANVMRQIEKIGGPEAQRTVRAKVLQRGSDAYAKILVDKNNEMFKGMSKQEYQLLNDYRESKRVVEIKGYKPEHMTTGGKTAAEHQAWLDIIPPDVKAKLDQVNTKVQEAFKANLDALLENGLIDQAGYENLVGFADYNPQRFMEHLDPVDMKASKPGKISVGDSGIKHLAEGSEGLLISDARFLLNEATARVHGRIFRNNVNKSLWDTIEANPNNGIFQKAKVARYTKDGKPIFQDAPSGYEKISVMLDGKENQMLMPKELAAEWVKNNPLINQTYATILSWALGSKILKASATGMNPAFALPNMMRDMVMVWSVDANKNYSPHSPVAMAQMANDLRTVFSDVVHKKGRYLDYIKEGGGMETLTQYGKIEGPLKQVSEVLGWVGNTSEFMTRLAYRERVLRNLEKQGLNINDPKVRQQATHTARNYLDFAQGGDLVKLFDIGVPYLNAGVQATKSMMNAAKKDPRLFAYKMAQIGGISTMIYTAARAINPDAVDQVDDRTKSNYWVIPLPEAFSYLDKDGQLIHSTIKIAKEQSVRPIASMFEAGMERLFTGKTPTQPTLNAIKDVFNIVPIGKLPPVLQAWMGYVANKDFYTNADIWKGNEHVENKERWDYQDNPFWKMVGENTGLDPKKTKYAMSQFFTGNNPVVSLMGTAYDAAFGDLPADIKQKAAMDLLSSNSIMRRVVGRTNPYVPHAQDVIESQTEEETARYVMNREVGKLTADFIKDNTDANKQKIIDYIDKQDEHERKRLTDRVLDDVKIHGMPDRSWWQRVNNIKIPEAKAQAFYTRWSKANDEEKDRLVETAEGLKGFLTERVTNRILELKRSGK